MRGRQLSAIAEHQTSIMPRTPYNGPFSMLPERRPPWKEFVLSMGAESFALLALAWVGVLHPEVLAPPVYDYHFIQLVNTPPPVNHQPAPVRHLRMQDSYPGQSQQSKALRPHAE